MKNKIAVAVISTSMLFTILDAESAEDGRTAYMPGSSMYTGAIIPPISGVFGELISNYTRYRKNNDQNGNDSGEPLNVDAYSLTFRGLWVTDTQLFGSKLSHAIIVPVVYSEGTVPSADPSGADGDNFSQGDIILSPFIFNWDLGNNYAVSTGLDISIPVGRYDKNDPINIGRNYWSFQPVMGFSYKDPEGFEAHILSRLMFNTENKDTDYRTGTEFNADISLGYNINKFRFGVHGYIYKQLTDDEWADGENIYLPDGFKSEAIGFGPSIAYQVGPAEVLFVWINDFESKNRGQGDQFYGKINFKF